MARTGTQIVVPKITTWVSAALSFKMFCHSFCQEVMILLFSTKQKDTYFINLFTCTPIPTDKTHSIFEKPLTVFF